MRQHVGESTAFEKYRPIACSHCGFFPIPFTIVQTCAYNAAPIVFEHVQAETLHHMQFVQRLRRYQLNARAIVSLANGVGTSANPGLATGWRR